MRYSGIKSILKQENLIQAQIMANHDRLDKRAIALHFAPLPEGQVGHMRVGNIRNSSGYIKYFDSRVPYDYTFDYLQDIETGVIWMSATPQEIRDHLPIVDTFPDGGNLLMAGLGVGLVLRLIKHAGKRLGQAVVIERDPSVIALVWPHVQTPEISLVNADVAEWLEAHQESVLAGTFDLVVMDTWPSGDYLYLPWVERIRILSQRLQRPGGRTFLWTYDRMISELRQELYKFLDLVPKINWKDKAVGFQERWPYFYPFMDYLITTWNPSQPTAWRRKAMRRVEEELQAFREGKREGLHLHT